MPAEEIRKRIKYPPLANRQKIEAVVFLELYIDKNGDIRNIVVLKDPGYGFAEAAVEALEGMKVEPAEANGIPVAVRYRYPIRFKLK
jgi:protein TonB